ncbi:MAG: hypothetical protein ACRCX8_08640 [Sarcina sp.]
MNKLKVFEKELKLIQNNEMRSEIESVRNILPDYFFKIPASSTGKYHPNYALGEGDLVRHTRAAIGIAVELFRNNTVQNFNQYEKDCIVGALILHDRFKGEGKTEFKHPLKPSQYLNNKIISNAIASHMGEWATSKYEECELRL